MSVPPLLLAAALALQAPAPADKPFVCEAGGFRVVLPGEPREKIETADTPLGPITFHMFPVTVGTTSYAASYSDLPEAVALADPDRALEGGVTGALTNTRGKLLVKRDIALGGHPGKEFSSRVPGRFGGTLLFRARIYLVGVRLHQVILCGRDDQIEGEAGDRVFRSFALLNPPPPPERIKPLAPGRAFSSAEGRYRVRFPEAPRLVVRKVPSEAGPIDVHMAVVDRGDVAYFASYNDYDVDPAAFDRDAALEAVLESALASSKATLKSRRDIALGGHPGRAYEATLVLPNGKAGSCRARLYMVGTRLYQAMVIETRDKEDPKATATFLDSFALLKAPTP